MTCRWTASHVAPHSGCSRVRRNAAATAVVKPSAAEALRSAYHSVAERYSASAALRIRSSVIESGPPGGGPGGLSECFERQASRRATLGRLTQLAEARTLRGARGIASSSAMPNAQVQSSPATTAVMSPFDRATASSADIRQALVEAVSLDLVGPDNAHPFAHELLPESPRRWYLTGYLVPTRLPDREADQGEDDDIDSPTETEADDAAGDDRRFVPRRRVIGGEFVVEPQDAMHRDRGIFLSHGPFDTDVLSFFVKSVRLPSVWSSWSRRPAASAGAFSGSGQCWRQRRGRRCSTVSFRGSAMSSVLPVRRCCSRARMNSRSRLRVRTR